MSLPTFPTVTINGYMVYTAKRWGQFPTISYTNGATAGAEVVTVDSSHNISVQIEDGVSTNAQIKAAIESHSVVSGFSANDLVSIAITAGHTADTNVTVKNASLAGGVAVKAAARTIGHLVYTAQTAGAAGNNIRVKYTSGASLSVSVATLDITVQLKNDGSSTNALIKAAIEASGPANALVACSSDGLSLAFVPTVAMAPAFLALLGGLNATAPSVEVQDLTFASDKTGPDDNGKTISYSTGATAGSEVVTVAPITGNVDVQIENGVSTAQQIHDALIAEPDFNGVAASGSVTISSYAAAHLTAASGTVVVVDYTKLTEETAVPSSVLTYGTPNDGDTVVITGLPTDGTKTFTKVAAAPSTDEFSSISELTTLINNLTDLNASDDATDITIVVATPGADMNSTTITGTGTYVALSITFSGGQDHAVLTVDGTALVEGTDWDAETSNDTTADNIVAALPVSVTGINTSGSIAVTAATAGAAGNSIALVTSDAVNMTISGALLTGGINAAVVSVNGVDLVESTDWNSVTSNDQAATNLAAAITAATATTLCTGVATLAVVAITANAIDASGNAITLVKTGTGLSVSGSGFLSGGIDGMTITISGTAGTAQKTVNAASMSGAVGVNTQGFYSDQSITALTASLVQFAYPFISRVITLANDETSGTDTVAFSFDGTNVHGTLAPGQSITWDVSTGKVIWLKYVNGAPAYRLIVKGD